ncbi:PREDICTED: uncharacterized protein LOC107103078 [Cyprinodon variegatus]|uniref:uncharacterized protein LOC107103078 n=1 Tax=Cyprinodon variegatus TaxID=28743 RepID=UPI000742B01E|nr:PREDICTED: uncharacterized protein LOC107103078 [Cyprinodon variegatus]
MPETINGTLNNNYVIHGQTDTAGYACAAGRGSPDKLDRSEPKFVLSKVFHPEASLTVNPEKEKHFTDHTVSLNCGGSSTEWRVMKYTVINRQSYLSDCSTSWEMTGSSCTINSQQFDESVYWCETQRGEFSNAVNITIYKPKPVLTVSASWLGPEASVKLKCQIEKLSAGWRFYWYKAVPDLSLDTYKYQLLSDNIKGTVEDSYIIHRQTLTAGYACRAVTGNPGYFTDYSEPNFVWSPDSHSAESLIVTSDREQHFTSESLTLNCGGNSTQWRVKRFTETGYLTYIKNCSNWRAMTGSSCTINSRRSYKAVYWCESGSGEFSNAVNISVQDGDLLLVSPVHPVTEGGSVTLSCRLRGHNTLSNVFFYHNDKLVKNDSRGELNISAVSQSDEGFYKCEHSGKASPQSWMAVKYATHMLENPSLPIPLIVGALSGKLLIIFLLLLGHFRDRKAS